MDIPSQSHPETDVQSALMCFELDLKELRCILGALAETNVDDRDGTGELLVEAKKMLLRTEAAWDHYEDEVDRACHPE